MGELIAFGRHWRMGRIPQRRHFVCLECGQDFAMFADLEKHWQREHHSPKQVQADAIDRAKAELE